MLFARFIFPLFQILINQFDDVKSSEMTFRAY